MVRHRWFEIDGAQKIMKLTPAYFILIAYIFMSALVVPVHAESKYSEDTVTLKSPPTSLERWYKPANKRQVWLHTMFRLRREMQAIGEYASTNDSAANNRAAMQKWIKRLDKDYNKIADMVPEWEKKIKPRLLPNLKCLQKKVMPIE